VGVTSWVIRFEGAVWRDSADDRQRHCDRTGGVDQPAPGKRVGPSALRPHGVAQPHHPFEYEVGETAPQHRIDPVMRRLIGRGDRQHHHHADADDHRDIGRVGHVAAGRCGDEMGQSRVNEPLGHRGNGA